MNKRSSSVISGIVLILFGLLLLMEEWNIIDFTWDQVYPVAMLLLSFLSFFKALTGNRNAAFWGALFFLTGLFYLLRNSDLIIEFWFVDTWPIWLFALGVSFFVLYAFKPHDWGVLIPGGILSLMGIAFTLQSLDIPWISAEAILNMWPLILILIGLGLIFTSLSKKNNESTE